MTTEPDSMYILAYFDVYVNLDTWNLRNVVATKDSPVVQINLTHLLIIIN